MQTYTRTDGAVIHADDPRWMAIFEAAEHIDELVQQRMSLAPAERRALALGLTPSQMQAARDMAKGFGGTPQDYYDAVQRKE